MEIPFRLILLVAGTLFVSAVPGQAATVQVTVEGLPSGLKVSERAEFHKCPPGTSQIPINVVTIDLHEQTVLTLEQNQGLGPFTPSASLLLVPRAVYKGDLTVHPPTNTGCTAIEDQRLSLFVQVLGEDANGNQRFREGDGGSAVVENNLVTVQAGVKARAATDQVLKTDGGVAVPTSLAKNTLHRLSVTYTDSFFPKSIKNPSIDLAQEALVFGHLTLVTRARVTLTNDGQVCLLVSNQNKCSPLSEHTLSNGAVTIEPSNISTDTVSDSLIVSWPILLNESFPSGNFFLVAAADDVDPLRYVVNGVAQTVQLLPWKSVRLPITVP